MADNYDDYFKDQLLCLLRERDRRLNFTLVWERDEIDRDLPVNNDRELSSPGQISSQR